MHVAVPKRHPHEKRASARYAAPVLTRARLRRIGGVGALAVASALVVGTAFGFTGSDRSAFRGQAHHDALVVQGQHGSEVLAPSPRNLGQTNRGLGLASVGVAVIAMLVASSRWVRRLVIPPARLRWRVVVPVGRRGPPLLPVTA